MKATSYILPGALLVIVGMGCKVAMDQNSTLKILVCAGKGLGPEPGGMELTQTEIQSEAAGIAKVRKETLDGNKILYHETTNAQQDMEAAKKETDAQLTQVNAEKAKLQDAEARREEIAQERTNIENRLHDIQGMENSDIDTAIDDLKASTQTQSEEFSSLLAEAKKNAERREELQTDVADKTVSLDGRNKENKAFMDTYRRNSEEFVIDAVNPDWHFVVFRVGKDSGLTAGDETKLLVHRGGVAVATLHIVSISDGQVVAEYDPAMLSRGLLPEVGDRVFREKPVGS